MAALVWDQTGEKIYETGDKQCVLYVLKDDGTYDNGVAWSGITAISSNDSGAEETALWADDIKYAVLRSAAEYGGTIEAYQCPEEFYQCDGSAIPTDGVIIGQQGRRSFGLAYVTTIGNDVKGTDYGYKIHLVYGCSASPSERSYQTINDSPDAMTLSWEFTTTPVSVGTINGVAYKPTAHIVIDSTKLLNQDGTESAKLIAFKEYLFGRDAVEASGNTAAVTELNPTLPLPSTVYDMLKATL